MRTVCGRLLEARGLGDAAFLPNWPTENSHDYLALSQQAALGDSFGAVDCTGLGSDCLGFLYENLLNFSGPFGGSEDRFSPDSSIRKKMGSYYTTSRLSLATARETLRPLLLRDAEAILALKVVDPAMGAGAFLLAALQILEEAILRQDPRYDKKELRKTIAAHCLHGVDRDPVAVLLSRVSLWLEVGAILPLPGLRCGDSLIGAPIDEPFTGVPDFFNWKAEFPDIFAAGGFDAVVGNPPWDTQKPSSQHFFQRHDPGYRRLSKTEALRRQQELFVTREQLRDDWQRYLSSFERRSEVVRHPANYPDAFPFCHQGTADLNSYKLFTELSVFLLRPGGQLGLILPFSLSCDYGSRELRKLLLEECAWRWLYGFENRRQLFDIHRSFKFCVVVAERGGHTEFIRTAFMQQQIESWENQEDARLLSVASLRAFSPNSLSFLEIRNEKDQQILEKLATDSARPADWGLRYGREFDSTNHAHLFLTVDTPGIQGPDALGRWQKEEILLPVYEGRMIGLFDNRQKGWQSGRGRTAIWQELPWDSKRVSPQFLIPASQNHRMIPGPKIAYMRVSSSTNTRTVITTYLRDTPANDSIFYFVPQTNQEQTALLGVGLLGSLVYDWLVRLRLGGLNLSEFLMVETPLPRPERVPPELRWLVLRLACGQPHFAREWLSFPERRRPWQQYWALTAHERLRLQCQLDALVAFSYGLSYEEFAWILRDCHHPSALLSSATFSNTLDPKGFWRADKEKPANRRHPVLSLQAFEALLDAGGPAGFCALNDGEGWMFPQDLDLGPRFFDWQSKIDPEESWAECTRIAGSLVPGPHKAVYSPSPEAQ